jgi:N-methylhydantoinase A/oxoprolinase/acetone carboxylase beta subunit
MLDSGYPRQSSAFHKIAGIRTNFTVPAVHNIALGGGSICQVHSDRTFVGPSSVGAQLERKGIYFGGKTLTVSLVPLTQMRVT